MGRPLAFDRDQALAQAMDVFWLKGSLQDLLAAMQLSKSSFYQSFHSKHTLFLRTVDRYRQQVTNGMLECLTAAPSGRQYIEALFSEFTDEVDVFVRQRGCFVMDYASEFAQRNADVAALVLGGMEQFEHVFCQAIARAQSEGGFPADRDAQAFARYLVSSRSGLKTMAKAGVSLRGLRRDTSESILNMED